MARTPTENRARIGQGRGSIGQEGQKRGHNRVGGGRGGRQVSENSKIKIASTHFALET